MQMPKSASIATICHGLKLRYSREFTAVIIWFLLTRKRCETALLGVLFFGLQFLKRHLSGLRRAPAADAFRTALMYNLRLSKTTRPFFLQIDRTFFLRIRRALTSARSLIFTSEI